MRPPHLAKGVGKLAQALPRRAQDRRAGLRLVGYEHE